VIGKNHDNFSLMDLAQACQGKTRWVLAMGVATSAQQATCLASNTKCMSK